IVLLIIILLVMVLFFFFQAEDGIRDRNVTGVQTCALPISLELLVNVQGNLNEIILLSFHGEVEEAIQQADYQWLMFYPCLYFFRSEERRVGKECISQR